MGCICISVGYPTINIGVGIPLTDITPATMWISDVICHDLFEFNQLK